METDQILFYRQSFPWTKITLVDKGEIITGDKEQAEIFRNFFSEAVANLDIKENPFILDETSVDNQNLNEIEKIISKFKNHPIIIQIKKKVGDTCTFKFRHVSHEKVFKKLKFKWEKGNHISEHTVQIPQR